MLRYLCHTPLVPAPAKEIAVLKGAGAILEGATIEEAEVGTVAWIGAEEGTWIWDATAWRDLNIG